ncbi:MAG TPA: hypothetical protein VK784_05935, partial [Pseudonocardiaceae bacterium]|nr:hypothetical protein [Pseudonocardiaceae bacterium]
MTAAPRMLPAGGTLGQSEWSGMSGAAVFVGDKLVGVVAEHAPRRGTSDLTLTPLDLLRDPVTAPANSSQWWAKLGVKDPATLPRMPTMASRVEPTYRATLRVIRGRTRVLLSREDELSRIAAFATGSSDAFGAATGSGGYLWLVGGAWAGKTALLAETVFTKPASVDVVAYFLIARESQASQEQFLAAVVPQLAWLLDTDTPSHDIHVFRDLWARAAQQAENHGRHLLLVVDGLDEDLRPGRLSVAAALPTEHLGQHARVLVASRHYPELPRDVDVHHPLYATMRVPLADSPHAAGLKILAEQEINALLPFEWTEASGSDLPFQILGLLTAAAGALSVRDLAAITRVKAPTVRAFITRRAARSLESVGSVEDPRYQFAHQTLLKHCQHHPDVGGNEQYRDQLNQWGEDWRAKGWPISDMAGAGTPRYLLDSYPAALMGDPADPARLRPDAHRLVALVADVGWVDAAIQTAGVDSVLAALHTARSAAPALADVSVMLAAVRGQAHHLRPPEPVTQPGYVLRQLCLQAAELADYRLTDNARTRLLALSDPGPVPLWSTRRANPAVAAELGSLDSSVEAVAVLPDRRVVTGGDDGRVRMWDPVGATPVEFGRHDDWVRAVAVLPDGRVVTGGDDRRVRVWDPA